MNLPDPSGGEDRAKKKAGLTTVDLGKITVCGFSIEANLFAAICYLPLFLGAIVLSVVALKSSSENPNFIRFNAMQSLIVSGGVMTVTIVLSVIGGILGMIPLIGGLLGAVLNIVGFVITAAYVLLSLKLVLGAFLGETYELPVIGQYARKYSKT